MAVALKSVQQEFFAGLKQQPSDPLLALIAQYRDDPREGKIDLGVGMYRNEHGITPVMRAVKAAERALLERQVTKGYLGPEGDVAFVELLKPIVFGDGAAMTDGIAGVQTPGGTGALRLAADLIAATSPDASIWLGLPTWPNYHALFTAARCRVVPYNHFDVESQALAFDEVMDALAHARRGDVFVLQGCCHNPTGSDFNDDQWAAIASALANGGLLPLFDVAYQGLGRGLELDSSGLRHVLDHVGEALVAYSCNKNFGLYRERTGALFAFAGRRGMASVVRSNMMALARGNWSMPPDHGAAVVRTILEAEDLAAEWRSELAHMRNRIAENRRRLAAADTRLSALADQAGMFSTLDIDPSSVERLKIDHAIYMAGSGRINVAGFKGKDDIAALVGALSAVWERARPTRS